MKKWQKPFRRVIALSVCLTMVWAPAAFATDFAALRTMTDDALRSSAPGPLSSVQVPEPPNIGDYVRDRAAAIALGKALFWDVRVGSDGVQACASCHFHAGADSRSKNQISPGLLAGDETFGTTPSLGGGPNYTLTAGDFPFPKDLNDVVSSQGVFKRGFLGFQFGDEDLCEPQPDIFSVPDSQGFDVNVRRVEPRNTPTTINAVFNHRNFWDGRANHRFNGVDPFGDRTNLAHPLDGPAPKGIWVLPSDNLRAGGAPQLVQISLQNASLASQAVGPPGSPFEMSCGGRTFPDLGRKILRLRALSDQAVAADDSVLAPYRHVSGLGLVQTYDQLIRRAFHARYWGARGFVGDTGFRQIEANFSLFWGLAIQLYEATLVSDQTPFDIFASGGPGADAALSDEEKFGLEVFLDKGKCINCHVGPEFTGAAVQFRACQPFGNEESVERMIMGDNNAALYDGGFYNIGVRQTAEDLGVGGVDAYGNALSFSRQANGTAPLVDEFCVDVGAFEVNNTVPPQQGERVAVNGAFKVPTIRNVELTAPFMHNGGHATLEQVVEFYDRGGDFRVENMADLDPDIVPLGLTQEEEQALVAFMKSLTDPRVKNEMAPFDHPALSIPNGHPVDENVVVESVDRPGEAVDEFMEIPAVGQGGRPAPPNFLD